MTFEKWWGEETFIVSTKEITRAAWQAATLAERERAATVAETHDADYWDDHAGKDIAAAIRKGEVV